MYIKAIKHICRFCGASVSTTIHVKYLSAYMTCLCQIENSVDNVFYVRDFPIWLQRLKKVLGIIPVQGVSTTPGARR